MMRATAHNLTRRLEHGLVPTHPPSRSEARDATPVHHDTEIIVPKHQLADTEYSSRPRTS